MNVGIDTDFLVRLNIREHPGRKSALAARDRHLHAGDRFALAPQVLAEFTHVVTDARRFENPLPMEAALAHAQAFWNATDVIQILPSTSAIARFFALMTEHRLGRKRLLDTLLAATCLASGVTHLLTGNSADYRALPGLTLLEL